MKRKAKEEHPEAQKKPNHPQVEGPGRISSERAATGLNIPQKHPHVTLERIEKFLSPIYFKDVNLFSDLYKQRSQEAVSLVVSSFTERVNFGVAAGSTFRPTRVGESFGPTWATQWFHVTIKIPKEWKGERVDFIWDSNSEAMIWNDQGVPLKAFTGGHGDDRRAEFILTKSAQGGEELEYYMEMACNGMFGAGKDGMINAPDPKRTFQLSQAEIAVANPRALALYEDLKILYDLAKDLPKDSLRGRQALFAGNAVVNAYHPGDSSTLSKAEEIVKEFFKDTNGSSQHVVSAIGHCHIDTAWLWPYSETKRKCARSWATQCDLMDEYPSYKFAASQAQQYEWVEKLYPSLFHRIERKIREGQFIFLGATWVEMDCNIPSGESFVRQFLYGQRYFMSHFGEKSKIFWLPDTFGYSAQLPQIIKQAGCEYFLTQKLSWNLMNKFPHTTFFWKGLDGSQVLTHFPPADTYNAHSTVKNVMMSVTNHKDVERSNRSMMVFGHGDGGGGPTWDMIHRMERFADVDGLPKVKAEHPVNFFERVDKEDQSRLVTWEGELYFELHRGTYTSQAHNKLMNRKNEFALQETEAILSIASLHGISFKEEKEELQRLWKLLMLNQFHDVIPGTSIGLVFEDSRKHYAEISTKLTEIMKDTWLKLLHHPAESKTDQSGYLFFNQTPFAHSHPIQFPEGSRVVNLQPYSVGYITKDELLNSEGPSKEEAVKVRQEGKQVILENGLVKAEFDRFGRLISFFDKKAEREIIPPTTFGNVFRYYEDIPLFWDAWDVEVYHLEKGWEVNPEATIFEPEKQANPLLGKASFIVQLSSHSKLNLTVSLAAHSMRLDFECVVDWNENRKFLKVEFPVNIKSEVATYEVQYGILKRPTHYNTSWDMAKFEVCGHKFADLSEFGYGVSLLNDSKYGYATRGNVLALSLLRAPKAPDDHCDIGHHQFKYALLPHSGPLETSDVLKEARLFNCPLSILPVTGMISESVQKGLLGTYFKVVGASHLILDTIKPSEDDPNAIIFRLYEAFGGRGKAKLISEKADFVECVACNLLEEKTGEVRFDAKEVQIPFGPFQVISLKARLKLSA